MKYKITLVHTFPYNSNRKLVISKGRTVVENSQFWITNNINKYFATPIKLTIFYYYPFYIIVTIYVM